MKNKKPKELSAVGKFVVLLLVCVPAIFLFQVVASVTNVLLKMLAGVCIIIGAMVLLSFAMKYWNKK